MAALRDSRDARDTAVEDHDAPPAAAAASLVAAAAAASLLRFFELSVSGRLTLSSPLESTTISSASLPAPSAMASRTH